MVSCEIFNSLRNNFVAPLIQKVSIQKSNALVSIVKKKTTIAMKIKGVQGAESRHLKKVRPTGEFVIWQSLVAMCCVVQPLAF